MKSQYISVKLNTTSRKNASKSERKRKRKSTNAPKKCRNLVCEASLSEREEKFHFRAPPRKVGDSYFRALRRRRRRRRRGSFRACKSPSLKVTPGHRPTYELVPSFVFSLSCVFLLLSFFSFLSLCPPFNRLLHGRHYVFLTRVQGTLRQWRFFPASVIGFSTLLECTGESEFCFLGGIFVGYELIDLGNFGG